MSMGANSYLFYIMFIFGYRLKRIIPTSLVKNYFHNHLLIVMFVESEQNL